MYIATHISAITHDITAAISDVIHCITIPLYQPNRKNYEGVKLTWKELLFVWMETERNDPKEKIKSIRFTEKQAELLQTIVWEAGYEDVSSFIRMLIRKFLEEQASEEND